MRIMETILRLDMHKKIVIKSVAWFKEFFMQPGNLISKIEYFVPTFLLIRMSAMLLFIMKVATILWHKD